MIPPIKPRSERLCMALDCASGETAAITWFRLENGEIIVEDIETGSVDEILALVEYITGVKL